MAAQPGLVSGQGASRMRVGVFGGAFDPPHRAHRLLAEAGLAQLRLDVLHILPTGQAWHKARPLSPAEHRLAMCAHAFGDLPHVRIDPRETLRAGPSYTADTLREIALEYPGAQLFLLLGADQLLAFKTWVRWQEVQALATLAVADRALDIGAHASMDQNQTMDLSAVDIPFERVQMPLTNISATAVRARAEQALSDTLSGGVLVPEAVARYISQHSLYQKPS